MTNRISSMVVMCVLGVVSLAAAQVPPPPPPPPPPPGDPSAARDLALSPATGTGRISGAITQATDPSRPIRRALVSLSGAELRGTRQAISDDSGRFVFGDLPAGRFTLWATKPGYLTTYYGATRSWRGPGAPIALLDGQTMADVPLRMPWGAVIAGTVTDAYGAPQPNLRVQVMQARTVNGQQRFEFAGLFGGGGATDDRGSYRIFGLPPGDFLVAASSLGSLSARQTTAEEIRWAQQQGAGRTVGATVTDPASGGPETGQMMSYAPAYFAGTSDVSAATTVAVGAGEERTGVDFTVQIVPAARVEGVVSRSDRQSVQGVQLFLLANSRVSSPVLLESPISNRVVVGADGKFTFRSVRPGRYTLTARGSSRPPAPGARPGPPVMDLWALVDVAVTGRDVSGVTVTLEPGLTVSGRVEFDGKTLTPPELPRVNISHAGAAQRDRGYAGRAHEPGDAGRHVRLSRRHPRSVSPVRIGADAARGDARHHVAAEERGPQRTRRPGFTVRDQPWRGRVGPRLDVHRPGRGVVGCARRRRGPAGA